MLPLTYVGSGLGSCYVFSVFVRGLRPTPFHISHGCLLVIENIDVWIDLVILLSSESDECNHYTFLRSPAVPLCVWWPLVSP